jgi:hypothetical protein
VADVVDEGLCGYDGLTGFQTALDDVPIPLAIMLVLLPPHGH